MQYCSKYRLQLLRLVCHPLKLFRSEFQIQLLQYCVQQFQGADTRCSFHIARNVVYSVAYNVAYNVAYSVVYNVAYSVAYNVTYSVAYNVAYNVV